MQHLLYRGIEVHLDNLVADGHRFDDMRDRRGSELLLGVVFSEFGELGYSGPAELEERAAEFTIKFRLFAKEVLKSGKVMYIPTYDSEEIKKPSDIAASEDLANKADPGHANPS